MPPRSSASRDADGQHRGLDVRVARGARRRPPLDLGGGAPAARRHGGRRRLGPADGGGRGAQAGELPCAASARLAARRRVAQEPDPRPGVSGGGRRLPALPGRRLRAPARLPRRDAAGRPPGLVPGQQAAPPERRALAARPRRGGRSLALVDGALARRGAARGRVDPTRDGARRRPRPGARSQTSVAARLARLRAALRRLRLLLRRPPRGLRARERIRHAIHGVGRGGRGHRRPTPSLGDAVRLAGARRDDAPPLASGEAGTMPSNDPLVRETRSGTHVEAYEGLRELESEARRT